MTFVETRPPSFSADLRCRPFQCKAPGSQNPRLRAVATAVEETATSAGTGGERQWEVEATAQQNPERLLIDPRRPRRRESRECAACEWTLLRPPECSLGARQSRPNRPCHSVFVCGSCCRFLPPVFWFNRVLVIVALPRTQPRPHSFPRWDFKLGFSQSVLTFPDCCETRATVVHEVADHHLCHVGVPLLHTGNAIGPTGPMGGFDTPCSQTQSQPSHTRWDTSCPASTF